MTIEKDIKQFAVIIEPVLKNMLQARNFESEEIVKAMQYAVLNGGKRFRPFLLHKLGESFQIDNNILLHLGACIELIHSYSLVHDDLPAMDNDDERRGKPSVHKKFTESTAILVGDALQSQAFLYLSDERLEVPNNIKIQLVNLLAFYSGTYNLISGQVLDIAFKQTNSVDKDVEQLLTINLLKTAKMFGLCGAFVAKLAKLESALESQIIYYCETLGILWQIVDDFNDAITKPSENANIVLLLKDNESNKLLEGYKNKILKLANNINSYILAKNTLHKNPNNTSNIWLELVDYILNQKIKN
jgi:geranylgeranyl pyrophosphate synthase